MRAVVCLCGRTITAATAALSSKAKDNRVSAAQIASGRNNMAVNTDRASVCTAKAFYYGGGGFWDVYTLRAAPRRRFNSILISCFVAHCTRYALDGGGGGGGRVTRASNKHGRARGRSVRCAPDDDGGPRRQYNIIYCDRRRVRLLSPPLLSCPSEVNARDANSRRRRRVTGPRDFRRRYRSTYIRQTPNRR